MRSFTLLELVVVVMILGVLATISFVHYTAYQERALDNEAQSNLALIIAAERVFRMESPLDVYYVSAVENDLNTNLRLFLSTAANRPWAYLATQSAAANPVCCAQATRRGGPMARSWRLCTNGIQAVAGACGAAAANCP